MLKHTVNQVSSLRDFAAKTSFVIVTARNEARSNSSLHVRTLDLHPGKKMTMRQFEMHPSKVESRKLKVESRKSKVESRKLKVES
ncbi:MAG: hypothetical protein LBF89_04280, partial [Bacteroidales bacterium]|jgi:hypothetical protein|nr:hypothetical protein [Bacteroidales bacterium]